MHVLKIFITGDIDPFDLASLTNERWIGQSSCLRHAIGNYFELNYHNYFLYYCDHLIFLEKKMCNNLANLRFLAVLRSCSYLQS